MNYPEGSLWHKWDLHVHTPCSIDNNYGGDNEEAWEKFIKDLENLPKEFKVIGINDYIFIEGYKKVLNYVNNGRLKNIDLFLPVIELRIDKFGGTNSQWNRVNFHVIFSNEIDPEIIEKQFLSGLTTSYKLSPEYEGIEWCAIPTKESLTDLGNLIIKSVPTEKRRDFGSPIREGFNALNHNFDGIMNLLIKNSYLKNKTFTAVGKTEWENIKWNDNTIAEKKNIVNKVDFLFTSSENVKNILEAKEKLFNSKVNDRLLDCSDSHNFSFSNIKDRIGKCFSWIKADTTFEGLRQIKFEPTRIFLGDLPLKLKQVNSNPTFYINNLEIRKQNNKKFEEKWFDANIKLNPGLVAIIGNKGSGKSALVDIISLLGNSHIDPEKRPFLNEKHFHEKGKSSHFEGEITWLAGHTKRILLSESCNKKEPEYVKYIPQNYFEDICNQLQSENEEGLFYEELSNVIYSHVTIPDRLGTSSLKELISMKTKTLKEAIGNYKILLLRINNDIFEVENLLSRKYTNSINNKISDIEYILEIHEKSKPEEIEKPIENQESLELTKIHKEIQKNDIDLGKVFINLTNAKIEQNKIETFLETIKNFEEQFENLKIYCYENFNEVIQDFENLFPKIISMNINYSFILEKLTESTRTIKLLEEEYQELEKANKKKIEQQNSLLEHIEEDEKKYRKYLELLKEWEDKKNKIIGDEQTVESLRYYEKKLNDIRDLYPEKLKKLITERQEITKKIFFKKKSFSEEYQELYKPIQDFIDNQDLGKDFDLRFSVSIVNDGYKESFFNYINHGNKGTFCGVSQAEKRINKYMQDKNFNEETDTINFINEIIDALNFDLRDEQKTQVEISTQLKGGWTQVDLYNFIFSLDYLTPRYVLMLDDKELYQLSPGEKGTLLLIFFLLVDKEKKPLIIDQPEQNLDNETIYNLLVKSVTLAKEKRQIFIVTHNPNLAVVCDAEQIIYAKIDKKDGNKVEYISGSIEEPILNKKLLDVLEGTKPAFDQRRFKYILD